MQLRQADLFVGLSPNTLKAVMTAGTRHAFSAGDFVYHRDDPADFLYILMEGDIRLRIGDEGTELFTITVLGEVFGWSSLIGRKRHTVSAVCRRPSAVLKMDKHRLITIFESDPESGFVFYQQLARALGNRLLQIYETVSECGPAGTGPSE
ncbi:MAG: Crp/Fnr family transcriptional regulator [Hyphomicrobiales bacterium]